MQEICMSMHTILSVCDKQQLSELFVKIIMNITLIHASMVNLNELKPASRSKCD